MPSQTHTFSIPCFEARLLFSFVFNGWKSSQLVLDGHEGECMTTFFFYNFTVKVLIPSFSRYQVFSFCRSFSTLPSLAVWWGKQSIVLYLCSCLRFNWNTVFILVSFHTLTRCPMAKANDFWMTLLRSLIPF